MIDRRRLKIENVNPPVMISRIVKNVAVGLGLLGSQLDQIEIAGADETIELINARIAVGDRQQLMLAVERRFGGV